MKPWRLIQIWRDAYPGRWGLDIAGLVIMLVAHVEADTMIVERARERMAFVMWLARETNAPDWVLDAVVAGEHRRGA